MCTIKTVLGIRSIAIVELTVDQFSYTIIEKQKEILLTKRAGFKTEASKHSSGERAAIKKFGLYICF